VSDLHIVSAEEAYARGRRDGMAAMQAETETLKAILRDLIAAYDLSAVAQLQLVTFDEMTQVRRELSLAEQDILKGLQYAYIRTGAAVGEVRGRAEEALKP
jgi:hypothetical protein